MNTAQINEAVLDQFMIADDMYHATRGLDRLRWAIVCDTLASLI